MPNWRSNKIILPLPSSTSVMWRHLVHVTNPLKSRLSRAVSLACDRAGPCKCMLHTVPPGYRRSESQGARRRFATLHLMAKAFRGARALNHMPEWSNTPLPPPLPLLHKNEPAAEQTEQLFSLSWHQCHSLPWFMPSCCSLQFLTRPATRMRNSQSVATKHLLSN